MQHEFGLKGENYVYDSETGYILGLIHGDAVEVHRVRVAGEIVLHRPFHATLENGATLETGPLEYHRYDRITGTN